MGFFSPSKSYLLWRGYKFVLLWLSSSPPADFVHCREEKGWLSITVITQKSKLRLKNQIEVGHPRPLLELQLQVFPSKQGCDPEPTSLGCTIC